MNKEIEIFKDIVTELLADEKVNPVVKPIDPTTLFNSLDLSLTAEGTKQQDFIQALKEVVLASPRTTTHRFFNQLFGGRNATATLGDLLATVLNNTMHTYKVAGPMVGIEKVMAKKLCDLIGYGPASEGTIGAGGSMTNFMGILMARDSFNEKIKTEGVHQTMIAYTSKESHYSVSKNATFIGIGRNNVRYIESTETGIMDVEDLEKQIQKDIDAGLSPFFVNGTAGTTVLGAFDPLDKIGEIAKKYNLWFHVDGAYCGSVLFSEKYKHLVKGCEKADSFTLNAHKMLGTPVSCSFIMVKDKKHLFSSFSNDASYLYQMDNDEYNPGKISFQCGRRNDGLKMWALWKSIGDKGLEKIVDHQFDLADIARDYIKNNPNYTYYSFDESIGVCFNYKNISPELLTSELYKSGKLMVGFGKFKTETFVRLVTINYGNKKQDILDFFSILEDFADNDLAKN